MHSAIFLFVVFARMSAVQVNDAKGTNVRAGDTKLRALERLGVEAGILEDKDGIALVDTEIISAEREPYVFKRLQLQQEQMEQPRQTTQDQFRNHFESAGVTATEEVMGMIIKHFASSATLANTPEQARDLYFEAALLLRSATRDVLQQQGITVAGVYRGSDPSKAVLLHACEKGVPRTLKIATEKSILHEYQVWSAVEATGQQTKAYLVPLEKVHFESAAIEIGDISCGSSSCPPVRCGLLMKYYQGTLAQSHIPLPVEILLRYGQYLHKAVSTLHQAGCCHLDIKPSNIFLFEGACYLGDYGAAARIGDPIHERTIKYYPKDGDFEAKEETDMYLLAVTLLEMFGTISQASQKNDSFTKNDIHGLIAQVESEQVREFLSSLFADPR
jgi:Protein kinase domain